MIFFCNIQREKISRNIRRLYMLFVRMVNVYFNVRTHAHSSHGTCEEFSISSLLLSFEFFSLKIEIREREENFTTFNVQNFSSCKVENFLKCFLRLCWCKPHSRDEIIKNCHTLTLPRVTHINFARLFFHRFSDYFLKLFFVDFNWDSGRENDTKYAAQFFTSSQWTRVQLDSNQNKNWAKNGKFIAWIFRLSRKRRMRVFVYYLHRCSCSWKIHERCVRLYFSDAIAFTWATMPFLHDYDMKNLENLFLLSIFMF